VARHYEIPWISSSEPETLEHCARNPPDLILLDLGQPTPEGVRLAARLSGELERDVLLLTSGCEAAEALEVLSIGALDALTLTSSEMSEHFLLERLAQISLLLRPRRISRRPAAPFPLVCVGASSGGPEALARLLQSLPPDFPAGVVLVQHVAPSFVVGLAQFLARNCALPVLLAASGERPRPGEVLLAGRGGRHLGMARNGVLARASVEGPRPSIDHFMTCVARYWNGPVLGVLLTGIGGDGAHGLLALRERGHRTLVQDPATSAVFGMPKSAIELGAADKVLPLDRIAQEIVASCC
jgi:chemotaxis response regulator CheB